MLNLERRDQICHRVSWPKLQIPTVMGSPVRRLHGPSPEAEAGGGGVVAISKTPTSARTVDTEPMNKNKHKHVSECFKDVTVDGKRGIGKLTVEKVCFFLG